MTAAQARLADTIDVFYGAADKTSEGAMAAHAYKRAVEELDTGIGRELVRPPALPLYYLCSALMQRSQEAPYRQTIMEPLGKMNAYFPIVNEHISKRNKKVRKFYVSIYIRRNSHLRSSSTTTQHVVG